MVDWSGLVVRGGRRETEGGKRGGGSRTEKKRSRLIAKRRGVEEGDED